MNIFEMMDEKNLLMEVFKFQSPRGRPPGSKNVKTQINTKKATKRTKRKIKSSVSE